MRLQHERESCYSARVVRVLRAAQSRRKSSAIAYAHLGHGCSPCLKNEIPSGQIARGAGDEILPAAERNPPAVSADGVGSPGQTTKRASENQMRALLEAFIYLELIQRREPRRPRRERGRRAFPLPFLPPSLRAFPRACRSARDVRWRRSP